MRPTGRPYAYIISDSPVFEIFVESDNNYSPFDGRKVFTACHLKPFDCCVLTGSFFFSAVQIDYYDIVN